MTSCFGLRSRHSERERLLTGALPTDWGSTLYDGSDRRPAIRRRSFDGRSAQRLAAQVVQDWMAAVGRQHSATNGCFREVKNQRPLFGDELEEMSVAFRPRAAVELLGKLSFNA